VPPEAHKYQRGVVEIRAGAVGTTGAAALAARGAQAAGAGLVRLVVDREIYPLLAVNADGVMVFPSDAAAAEDKTPDAALLGPGWGKGAERLAPLERALALEESGVPLVLDADALALVRNKTFHGLAALTPHMGEFAALTDLSKAEASAAPGLAAGEAAKRGAVIVLKSHNTFVAAPDGRLVFVEGNLPGLASGGSGDLLAGFCAAIAGRWRALAARGKSPPLDLFTAATAAAALLAEAGRSPRLRRRFSSPMEIADRAASLAGEAWLP
jgi:NAD(P)H-hydrate epimerase